MFKRVTNLAAISKVSIVVFLCVAFLVPISVFAAPPSASVANKGAKIQSQAAAAISDSDLVTITWSDGYGAVTIDKWMLQSDGVTPADWLGQKYQGKQMQEPINLVICDSLATSPDNAKSRLESFLSTAGYPSRYGHSSGYKGHISGTTFTQMPTGVLPPGNAYSDNLLILDNNHGRIFGPYWTGKMYVFIAAFSRETGTTHNYVSFNQARNDLAAKLTGKAGFVAGASLALFNQIAGTDPSKTTGDHDGNGAYLWATK